MSQILDLANGSKIKIKEGEWVGLFAKFLHMDPEIHPNPEILDIDRYVSVHRKHTGIHKME